jgi:membrane protease YdiL (CAAX protease family)
MRFSAAILAVILSYTWLLEPRLPQVFVAVPGAIVLALGLWHALRTGEWGLRQAALLPGLRATALFTIPAVVALLAAGAAMRTLHARRDSFADIALLVAWGGAQQWLLQTVVLRDAQRVTSRRAGLLLAAFLFAAVHLPNPFLTAMTFAGALAWCALYDRHPNVVPLAFSHAIVTLAILHAFDGSLTGRLRIGQSYLRL